jgi:hypothetical protein
MKNSRVGLDVVSVTELMKEALDSGNEELMQSVEIEMRTGKLEADEGFVLTVVQAWAKRKEFDKVIGGLEKYGVWSALVCNFCLNLFLKNELYELFESLLSLIEIK